MVAINFKKEFADLVESGQKHQTIREKCRAFTGCKLQLYYGQRTKQCRKLRDAICKRTIQIRLTQNLVSIFSYGGNIRELDDFAKKDGFKNYLEMWKFFQPRADENGEFWGWLIEW